MRAYYLVILLAIISISAVSCPKGAVDSLLTQGTDVLLDKRTDVDYVLILDRSGSMKGDKLTNAKQSAIEFIKGLSGNDRAAIIGFDDNTRIYSGLSNDKSVLEDAINRITPGDFTRYTPAFKTGADLFNGNKKVIVFLSDGKPSESADDVISLISDYTKQGICIYTIAYAQSAELEAQKLLHDIVLKSQENTGCGKYFRSQETTFALTNIFEDIYSDVSSQEVFNVTARISTEEKVVVDLDLRSKFNDKKITGDCLTPQIDIALLRYGEVVKELETTSLTNSFELPEGIYDYIIKVTEDCGGECLYSGSTKGSFSVSSQESTCKVPWDELRVVLTSTDYVEVQITPDGFNPQTVGTTGVVTWRNTDVKPHRVVGSDGTFSSPVIPPGGSWSHVFPPGEYSYIDTESSFSGVFENSNADESDRIELYLVIDTSGSMIGDPLKEAKAAAINLLSVLSENDKVSLIAFSDDAYVIQELSSDIASAKNAVRGLISDGATKYIPAFEAVKGQLRGGESTKQAVIFLSDGLPYDEQGKEEIISSASKNLRGACVYTIGYGSLSFEAQELLSEIATNSGLEYCGAYYQSGANKKELSSVFGEIYAATQNPGLELYDTTIQVTGRKVFITTKVRSVQNGISLPSAGVYGCVPKAEVYVQAGPEKVPLVYNNSYYGAELTLGPGEHSLLLTAKVQSEEDPLKASVGSLRETVSIKTFNFYFIPIIIFIILLSYLYITRHKKRK